MLGRDHEIVGNSCRCCRLEDSMVRLAVGFDLVEGNSVVADCIHVKVETAKMVENKVSNGIGALDGEVEVIPNLNKRGVLGGDKVSRGLVGP